MSHAGWVVVLVVCLLVTGTAGLAIASSGDPADLGSIEVADGTGSPKSPAEVAGVDSPRSAQVDEQRASAAPRVPVVDRISTEPDQAGVVEQPTRVRVADVGLDAVVEATGVRGDGLMEIPDDGDRAGWYRHGATPGSGSGSVVIAGHVDTDEGLGAMAALREVSLGSRVEVEMSDGSVRDYEIVGRRSVAKDDLPTTEIFDREGPERLTLVTCGGPWRSSESSYRDNVVVVAMPTAGE